MNNIASPAAKAQPEIKVFDTADLQKWADGQHDEAVTAHIAEAVRLLWGGSGTTELRIFKDDKDTRAGYYRDPAALVRAAQQWSEAEVCQGVYILLNEPDPLTYARSPEAVDRLKTTTSDANIIRYRRLLLDFERAGRVSGVSAPDADVTLAVAKAREVREYLREIGWPEPLLAMSGNGGHLVYGLDIPYDHQSNKMAAELVKKTLSVLNEKFGGVIKIDQTTFNPSRVSKLYGTWCKKGHSIKEAPHRLSHMIEAPHQLIPVTVDQLRALTETPADPEADIMKDMAAEAKRLFDKPKPTGPKDKNKAFDFDQFVAQHLEVISSGPYIHHGEPATKHILACCPFDNSHVKKDACLIRTEAGQISFKCLHDSCSAKGWKDVRQLFDPGCYDKKPEAAPAQTSDPKPKTPAKTNAGKFGEIADGVLADLDAKGQHGLYHGKRFYTYRGTHYAPVDELAMTVREWMAKRTEKQSNNVVGNVVPIIHAACWQDQSRTGPMPFWKGTEPCPFNNFRSVIPFANGLYDLDTGDVADHSADWCSSVCLPYDYDAAATCPAWTKFLHEVFAGDVKKVALLQEYIGYLLESLHDSR